MADLNAPPPRRGGRGDSPGGRRRFRFGYDEARGTVQSISPQQLRADAASGGNGLRDRLRGVVVDATRRAGGAAGRGVVVNELKLISTDSHVNEPGDL